MTPLDAIIGGGVRAVFQPLVDLETEDPIGYEALARGPAGGPLEAPDALFGAARDAGRIVELEMACQERAVDEAARAGLAAPAGLFLNVEPAALASATSNRLLATWERALERCPVVIELTERALTTAPADLLRQVEALRERGFLIALDDVGADERSLALMPFLTPDIIKLDLRLVQDRPSDAIAEVVHGVWAEAERTGAEVVAEGIETEEHVETARSFGASVGQGWRFGRPAALEDAATSSRSPLNAAPASVSDGGSPFELVAARRPLLMARKRLLLAISRRLENHALTLGRHGVTFATFEELDHFGEGVADRYERIGERSSFVGVFSTGMPPEPRPGLRGQQLSDDEPLRMEWDVCVIGPHFAGALIARDLGDTGVPDVERRFEYSVTYDRGLAVQAARLLMGRIEARG